MKPRWMLLQPRYSLCSASRVGRLSALMKRESLRDPLPVDLLGKVALHPWTRTQRECIGVHCSSRKVHLRQQVRLCTRMRQSNGVLDPHQPAHR